MYCGIEIVAVFKFPFKAETYITLLKVFRDIRSLKDGRDTSGPYIT